MRYTRKRIYDLLPEIYRQRDAENDYSLRPLMDIIAEQLEIVQSDISGLYENWFIETCDEWVVPYIADLLRVKIPNPVSSSTYSQRAWVANILRYRRRKGTAAMLEFLAKDVTGWDAKVVEFFENLITTQYLNHLRPAALARPDLRDTERLDRLSTPFNNISHTIDVRRISKNRGYYNIPNIGIFLWRIRSLPVYNAPAFDHGDGKYSFNRLGYDEPLYNHPRPKENIHDMAAESNISLPIRMRALNSSLLEYYFGEDNIGEAKKSIQLIVDGRVKDAEDVVVCDLSDWIHRPENGRVAIDPVLGRILFPTAAIPESVRTFHYYGFGSEMGGGFYIRSIFNPASNGDDSLSYIITKDSSNGPGGEPTYKTFVDAIAKWQSDGKKSAIFEIKDCEVYEESGIALTVPQNTTLVFRANQGQQPILLLKDPIKVKGEEKEVEGNSDAAGGSKVVFDGLLFTTSQDTDATESVATTSTNLIFNIMSGDLSSLSFYHCTLVPGRNEDSSLFDSRLLFEWQAITTNPEFASNLKNFLLATFEDLLWISNDDVAIQHVSDDTIKISSTSLGEVGSYVTISFDDDKTGAIVRRHDLEGDTPGSPRIPTEIYRLGLNTNEEGKIEVYNPKLSLMSSSIKGNDRLRVLLENTICGTILMVPTVEAHVQMNNSILDGKGSKTALTCFKSKLENSTIFGQVHVSIMETASNVMFYNIVNVERTQQGCVRFCHIPVESRTPRRYRCQPEYFNSLPPSLTEEDSDQIVLNLTPRFVSISYGDPGYAQLHRNTSRILFEGADNGSEIGVFNNIYHSQRIKNLESSLQEYLRFGLEAGIFLVDPESRGTNRSE
jgi:hypothetical protein